MQPQFQIVIIMFSAYNFSDPSVQQRTKNLIITDKLRTHVNIAVGAISSKPDYNKINFNRVFNKHRRLY